MLICESHSVKGFRFLYLLSKSTADRSDIQRHIFLNHTRNKESDTLDSQYLGNHTHPYHQTFEHLIDREMSAFVAVFFVSVAAFLFG